ncbi:hmg-i/hmg-y, DNA-binding protein [Diplocarpon rosae]|nr:hmg-i/hmg-y, DNA-binding protein [Diplocarpon rosae]
MAQAQPRPSSGQNQHLPAPPAVAAAAAAVVAPAASASSRPTALSVDAHQGNSPNLKLSTSEAAELASTTALIEGVLGPNKDGRVRNPVPSKLKGKTDNKQGNFGVMHMGSSPGRKHESLAQGKDIAAERDAAARRTSENTASRAKAAQADKYIPPKKRGLDAGQSRNSLFGGPRETQRSRPLAPDETKSEQARLLTLLRSINPVTVVDQICKAVAYFGGIPGAPPPEDGIFPESANTRETGALFIGWLAEIFPDVTVRSPEISKGQAAKKRGRSSNAGIKDVPVGDAMGSSEPPNSRNGYGYGPAVSAPTWGLPQSLALVNTPTPVPLHENKHPPSDQSFEQTAPAPVPAPAPTQAPTQAQGQASVPAPTPAPETLPNQAKNLAEDMASGAKKRRGRPKGSRNKGKDGQDGDNATGSTDSQTTGQPNPQSPNAQPPTAKVVPPVSASANSSGQTFNTQSAGPKTAQKNQYSGPWQAASQLNQVSPAAGQPPDELSAEERAVLEAFRQQGPETVQQVHQVDQSPILPPKTAPEGGLKRKRAPAKPKPHPAPAPQFSSETITPQQPAPTLPPENEASMGVANDAMQWNSVETTSTTPILPPAKRPRQRKTKVPANTDPPARTQTASVVSTATPPIPPSKIPDSQEAPSQQPNPATRPPAEGLEAHYAFFQQQQNERSHTPTPTQQPQQPVQQQQARQQPKIQSVPPQQPTPQMQQQHLMQHQKPQPTQQTSQQTIQRDEQKLTLSTATRPSSNNTFYNQGTPASTSFSQYPSNQPPQLYTGHQASPQMGNSTNNYRASSTHALGQASPQFSQTENAFRTASPHTLGQSSPSFSQASTNYRTSSTHNLAQQQPQQQSPAVTPVEPSYRTPSTHSIVQPSPTYTTSRSHSLSQPSHQSHYSHFSDSSYIDLPTLESLGHSGTSSVGMTNTYGTTAGFGQGLGVGLGHSSNSNSHSHSRSSVSAGAGSNILYGSTAGAMGTGMSGSYDAGPDLLRGIGVSRSGSAAGAYGSSSRLSGAFDPGSQDDLRDQMLRGYARR